MTPGYLALGGLFIAVWLGGGNFVGRRLIIRTKGPLGAPNAVWVYRGMFFAPDWLSFMVMGIGGAVMVAAGVWALVDVLGS